MAVGLRIKFVGGTEEQYNVAHGAMDVEGNPPEGLIFHSAGPIDEGWGIIDFWESREAFDRFIQDRFQPALGQVGDRTFQSPPEIKEFPVHNFDKP